VFLEERTPRDLIRNGVVSVFLRTMEYCQGIMLLTTNRVTEFDPAALSRIHLKVKYDDLTSKARREVWAHTSSPSLVRRSGPAGNEEAAVAYAFQTRHAFVNL